MLKRLRHFYKTLHARLHRIEREGMRMATLIREESNTRTSREDAEELKKLISPVTRRGLITIGIFLLLFGVWGGTAPIDSAAIAHGSIILQSNRKTIQHLEGGIIDEILVKEGEFVKKDMPLIRLNDTAAKARQELLTSQWRTAKVNEARLVAERDSKKEFVLPEDMQNFSQYPDTAKVIDSQQRLFFTRTQSVQGQVDVLENQIKQYKKQIGGLQAQKEAARKQLALTEEETRSVEELFNQGYEKKPRLLALQRSAAELKGKEGEYISEISKTNENITEARLKMYNIRNEFLKESVAELKEGQQQIAELEEQIRASDDILSRTIITAPQDGKVTGLKFHTVGGVINSGAPIMDIIPQNDRLIVEAHVSPQDIDIVHEGLPAKVMLSAYKSRYVPRLSGIVTYVSADSFMNETAGTTYYIARVEISDAALEKLRDRVELYPGMPAETFIVTGSRTFLAYLFSPILNSFRTAFKEN